MHLFLNHQQQSPLSSTMSSEVLSSHQPRVLCLPNPEDYSLLSFIGEKILLLIISTFCYKIFVIFFCQIIGNPTTIFLYQNYSTDKLDHPATSIYICRVKQFCKRNLGRVKISEFDLSSDSHQKILKNDGGSMIESVTLKQILFCSEKIDGQFR